MEESNRSLREGRCERLYVSILLVPLLMRRLQIRSPRTFAGHKPTMEVGREMAKKSEAENSYGHSRDQKNEKRGSVMRMDQRTVVAVRTAANEREGGHWPMGYSSWH